MRFFRAPCDHLKFSICHAFLATLTSDMASNRPSGDGIANAMKLLERSRTETLPSSATFNNALSRRLCHGSRRLFPSADQSTVDNPLHPFTTRSCVLSEDVERNWIVASLTPSRMTARCEPSGDKLQLHGGSICAVPVLFPLFTSNRYVSTTFPLVVLYMQTVDGKRAHCTIKMLTSLRTKRDVPPAIGTAKIEDGFSGVADLGVEKYNRSEPSYVTRGSKSCSVDVTKFSANG